MTEQDNTGKLPTIDSIIDYIKLSEGTDAKMTEIGWERFGENIDVAKQTILALKAKWEREAVDSLVKSWNLYIAEMPDDKKSKLDYMECTGILWGLSFNINQKEGKL